MRHEPLLSKLKHNARTNTHAHFARPASLVAATLYTLRSGALWTLSPLKKVAPDVVHFFRLGWGKFARMYDMYVARTRTSGTPMNLDGAEWGVATVLSKEDVGGSGYVKYTFGIGQDEVSTARSVSWGKTKKVSAPQIGVYRHSFLVSNSQAEPMY